MVMHIEKKGTDNVSNCPDRQHITQMFLTKFNDKYEVGCHDNVSCASSSPTAFKTKYEILKAYKNTEYVDLCYLLSLCNKIHKKL